MQHNLPTSNQKEMPIHGGSREMTLADERLYQDCKIVALKDLRLDPKNVRFRHMTSLLTEKQMEDWLYEEEDVKQLIKQILIDGRIQQPIYVVNDEQGKYIVKEGNRRTVALRKLSRDLLQGKIKDFEKDHFDFVPVHIVEGTEHEIKVFIGQIHVSGPKAWDAVNKASVIYDLIEKEGDTIESVAEELGMTKGKVSNYYKAFQATERYGKRFPHDKNYVPKFSYFMELYQSQVLKTWLQEDPENLDYFIDLVEKNKLKVTYKGVRQLAKIIASPSLVRSQALAVLNKEDGDIEKAFSEINENKDAEKGIWSNVEKLHKSLLEAKYDDFSLAIQDETKLDLLEHLIDYATDMRKNILKLRNSEAV